MFILQFSAFGMIFAIPLYDPLPPSLLMLFERILLVVLDAK